jgi:hypothetical protein
VLQLTGAFQEAADGFHALAFCQLGQGLLDVNLHSLLACLPACTLLRPAPSFVGPAAQLHANLLGAHSLLQRVSGMGPLLSLIKAYSVRDEFLRVNKDIVNTFAILAAGEQLLVRHPL